MRVMQENPPLRAVYEGQQIPNRSTRLNRVPESLVGPNTVVVLAANFFAFDKSTNFELGDDPLHGPLGDSDLHCHLSKHQGRISRQEQQHVRIIRQKRPMGNIRF